MLPRSTFILLLLAVALYAAVVEAFSPLSYSPQSVSKLVKENQRFQPLDVTTTLEEDDDDDEIDIDNPSDDDYLVKVGDLEGDDTDTAVGVSDDGKPPAWAESIQRMQALREKHRRHENDTGSPEYQIAGMSERILYLSSHLQTHPKDFSTRRGLVALVNKRRRLLNYLSNEDVTRYRELVASLGIRHKAPGAVSSREEKYARFPSQKAIKPHLLKNKV